MNKTLIIQSNLLIDTKKPDGAKYSTLPHLVILRTHVMYARIESARLGVQNQSILQFQSFNPKKGFNTDRHYIFTGYGTKSRRVPDGNTAKVFMRAIGF